jgi:transposase
LIQLVQQHGDWLLGFEDETWWSRFEHPRLSTWMERDQPLRLVEQVKQPTDPDRKALACYGLLARFQNDDHHSQEQMWLRFVQDRPVSAITIQFLEWGCVKAQALGKSVLVIIWDNASWHISKAVRQWLRQHNQLVKRSGHGVRLLVCPLPIKSPWLNPIEPKWAHGKRRIAQADRTLSAQEMVERVCATFDCPLEDHLAIPEKVA